MTRTEAQQNHKNAMLRLKAARSAVKAAGLSDIALATKLQNEQWEAETSAKVAARLRTQYAPAI